jgi:hypothetical protein
MDIINNRFYVRIKKNLTKRVWFGVCILNVAKKFNFVHLNAHSKGVYALDQGNSNGYSYSNPSNHASTWNHPSLAHNQSAGNSSSIVVILD